LKAKVAAVRCASYDSHEVPAAVSRALDLIGGLDTVVKTGDRVLIKPNLLAPKKPEQATTTHPEVVAAVAEAVRRVGGSPMIGDSPGGMRRELDDLWEITGMKAVSEKTGVPLVNIEAGGSCKKQRNGRTYYLSKLAIEADVIVNLPKLKTHSLVLFTGAVKNMYGLLPGFRKKETHLIYPKPGPFSEALVDIYSFIMPQLTVMDAVQGMDGDGPAAGRRREVGLLLAGRDAVAVDAVAGRLVGIDPEEISTCRLAARQGLGVCSPEEIAVVGDDPEALIIEKFIRPRSQLSSLVPTKLVHLLKRFIYTRPQILPQACTNCNTCVKSCPTGAMVAGSTHPEFRPENCIACLCCHELCPESAIRLKWSLMARMIP
jgi:uncharacterized protein (DUF362 family)/Pyruvate/2-oxoacid:ferredoxin oxidoreductase delta subunit